MKSERKKKLVSFSVNLTFQLKAIKQKMKKITNKILIDFAYKK